jgi:uncharacterized damage-inducible protein DinB
VRLIDWAPESRRYDLLRDVDAGQAARRPVGGGHSIWEIVLHLTAWQREVARRLEGEPPGLPAEGDWPPAPEPTPAAWRQAVESLAGATQALALAAGRLDATQRDRRVGESDRPLGTGVTIGEMLVGILQHNAYHSGQVALLKRDR